MGWLRWHWVATYLVMEVVVVTGTVVVVGAVITMLALALLLLLVDRLAIGLGVGECEWG